MHTVTGERSIEDITGRVLPHEHLAIDLRTDTDREGYLDCDDDIIHEVSELKKNGNLGLIIDQTCRGMGRDALRLRTISELSGVDIVCATGWYYRKFHPEGEPPLDVGAAQDIVEKEILVGVDESLPDDQIKAGVIGEVGTHGENPEPHEEVALRAAARAGAKTGTPVATHAHLGTGAISQLRVLEDAGADMEHVLIGHQDLFNDSQQHQAIARTGAYVGFDTIGKASYQSDKKRCELIVELVEAGYEKHIVLSNDISRYGYLNRHGGQGYRHVFSSFLDKLSQAGLTPAHIDLFTKENPLRWLNAR